MFLMAFCENTENYEMKHRQVGMCDTYVYMTEIHCVGFNQTRKNQNKEQTYDAGSRFHFIFDRVLSFTFLFLF